MGDKNMIFIRLFFCVFVCVCAYRHVCVSSKHTLEGESCDPMIVVREFCLLDQGKVIE